MASLISRRERFERVGSTNDVVRGWLADGTAGGLPRRRRRADGGSRSRRAASGSLRRAPALLLSLGFRPTWLDAARGLAAGRAHVARDGRGGRGRSRPAGRHRSGSSGRTTSSSRRAGTAFASSPACSARPTAWARPTRASSSGSASTSTGRRPTSRPSSPATMTSLPRGGRRSTVERGAPCWSGSSIASRRASRRSAPAGSTRLGWTVRQVTTGRTIRLETPSGVEDRPRPRRRRRDAAR